MSLHSILVFIHVLAGIGLFAALAIETPALARLRAAQTTADVRMWMGVLAIPARLGPWSMLANFASGVWLMIQWWGPYAWIQAAMAGVILVGVAGGAVTGRRMRRLRSMLAHEPGPVLTESFRALRSSSVLVASLRLRMALLVGIVALMTIKPGLAGSVIILSVSVFSGLITGMRSTPSSPVIAPARSVQS